MFKERKKVKIVRLRICQGALLNYGMHTWSTLMPEIEHSTSLHKMKTARNQNLSSLFSSNSRNHSAMYMGIFVSMLTYD